MSSRRASRAGWTIFKLVRIAKLSFYNAAQFTKLNCRVVGFTKTEVTAPNSIHTHRSEQCLVQRWSRLNIMYGHKVGHCIGIRDGLTPIFSNAHRRILAIFANICANICISCIRMTIPNCHCIGLYWPGHHFIVSHWIILHFIGLAGKQLHCISSHYWQ